MAFADRLGGLLSGGNPLFNLGIGLLSASGPSAVPRSLGQVLAQGTQFASQRQLEAAQNEAIRNELKQRARQQQAQEQLVGLLQAPERTPAGQSLPAGNGVLATQDQRQGQLTGLLAQAAPEAAVQGLLSQMFAKPSSLQTKLADVQTAIGRPLTNDEVLKIAGGGTTINIGEQRADKAIPTSELSNIRLPDGSTPPLGTTYGQAEQAGARVTTADQRKRQVQLDNALGVLTQLKSLQSQIDETGIIPGVGNSVLARFANGLGNAVGAVLGTEGSQTRTVFRDLSRGTVGPLIRTLGDSGALSDGDVQRALSLLSDNGGLLPDSTRVARRKLEGLEEIFKRAARNLENETGPSNEPEMPKGVSIEWID